MGKDPAPKKKGGQETFGERLRRLRKARGFTQAELARALGISQPTVAYYENEDGRPGGDLVLKLSEALAVSPEEILAGQAPRRRSVPETPENLRLWRKLKQVERLSPTERRQVIQLIDALVERDELKRQKAS
jgi:transcriptional regulator with XRE-family HTH domain